MRDSKPLTIKNLIVVVALIVANTILILGYLYFIHYSMSI